MTPAPKHHSQEAQETAEKEESQDKKAKAAQEKKVSYAGFLPGIMIKTRSCTVLVIDVVEACEIDT